jgi:hypothetical protein
MPYRALNYEHGEGFLQREDSHLKVFLLPPARIALVNLLPRIAENSISREFVIKALRNWKLFLNLIGELVVHVEVLRVSAITLQKCVVREPYLNFVIRWLDIIHSQ